MTTFILRILFSGMMAFIPNENGTEVTVLLLNTHHYHTSDGAAMQHHEPLLVARAGGCTGDCVTNDQNIASFLYRDQSASVALDSLAAAVANGSAWAITGSDLGVRKATSGAAELPALSRVNGVRGTSNGDPLAIPTTAAERRDVSWIASLNALCGTGCTLDPDLFDAIPPSIVAARFKLDTGTMYTHSVARIGANVTPVRFERLDGTGSPSPYSQSVAAWVAADIEVTGSSVEIYETKHDGTAGRSMILSPDTSGKAEIALLNLPPFVPPASSNNAAPQVGAHVEMYYDLLSNPPARESRLVPRAGALEGVSVPEVAWSLVHPSSDVYSELLNRLRLDVGRSVYDRTICPPLEFP